ncbi:hypothetical protein OCC_14115 [Thermococcus litoralis DSM 5473]|uniref:Uncharacterized protein n=1 Tax=Thermococcus litoralis (strain ATCC 51850 / DSM 5473 / JCM 8560 / NS-C) TaxID=523849 RepID=S5Z4W3_THELN|nr:hypothetical protein OCC_14115 [Thermococcus litoralis DSM 5473]
MKLKVILGTARKTKRESCPIFDRKSQRIRLGC